VLEVRVREVRVRDWGRGSRVTTVNLGRVMVRT